MMAYYPYIKAAHVGFVTVSFCLFVLRGRWALCNSPRRHSHWARTIPHVNDALLLGAGLTLALLLHQYPFQDAWLSAKLAGLLVHIALGALALRAGLAPGLRYGAWLGSLAAFLYIVAVAVTRSPWPFG